MFSTPLRQRDVWWPRFTNTAPSLPTPAASPTRVSTPRPLTQSCSSVPSRNLSPDRGPQSYR